MDTRQSIYLCTGKPQSRKRIACGNGKEGELNQYGPTVLESLRSPGEPQERYCVFRKRNTLGRFDDPFKRGPKPFGPSTLQDRKSVV